MNELSIEGFVAEMARLTVATDAAIEHALDKAGKIVEAEAKRSIGEYQDAAGPFVAWAELADATKDERVRLGFSENEPGLRTGEMRASIGRTLLPDEVQVGSDDDKLVYFELGTSKQPPRSVLGGALARKVDEVTEVVGYEYVGALFGEGVAGGRLPIESPDE